jgi:hypothetical protein
MAKIITSKVQAFNSIYIFYNYRENIIIHLAIIWIYSRCNIYISLITAPINDFQLVTVFLYNWLD